MGTLVLVGMLGGCTAADDDSGGGELPPEDTAPFVEDTGTFPFDTSDTGADDESPVHWLTLTQSGTWQLGGDLEDPSSMTGALEVRELLDGDTEAPACLQTWSLVGTRAEAGCDGCFTFSVEHTRLGADGECRTPELPEEGEVRTLGWSEAEATIHWDWYDTGVWVPLWDTVDGKLPGELLFSWEEVVGVKLEDSGM